VGWLAWLLIFALSAAAMFLLAAWLIRFRYRLEYAFPDLAQGEMSVSFLLWRKSLPFRPGSRRRSSGDTETAPEAAPSHEAAGTAASDPGAGREGPAPRAGQEGFLAVPVSERMERFRKRMKAAALKWAFDLGVWRLFVAFTLRSGFDTLRFVGPSLEHLHVGSAHVSGLGRFAAAWSTLSGMLPFLACPVEYGFNERPFALRFRLSGGCSLLGFLAFVLAWFIAIPWLALWRRFVHCWRNPRPSRWQRRLMAEAFGA
jgi:hypothetical protein